MDNLKPILSVDEQIKHLKDKGVRFEIMDEESARRYLTEHNNFFNYVSYHLFLLPFKY